MKTIIDISSHTTVTDYNDLKQHCDGVYIKATEGGDFISSTLDAQVQACRQHGIPFGVYHFAGKIHSATEEYIFFKSIAERYPDRLLPDCLDYETNLEDVNFVNEFMAHDAKLIFYTYREMFAKTSIPKQKTWIAIPLHDAPTDLTGFFGIQFHLSTNVGTTVNCDLSLFDDSILTVNSTIQNIKESVKMVSIKKGEKSNRVKLLQTILNVLLNINLKVDCDFGTNTYNAVVSYQTAMKIDIDGVVGPQTITTLLDDLKVNWFKCN